MNDEESKNVKEEIKKEKTTFCENVKLLREVCGLSKEEMIKICGIGINSLSKIESGVLPPKLSCVMIINLADYFKLNADMLFSVSFNELLKKIKAFSKTKKKNSDNCTED